jgi:hypothetical protein
MPNGAGTGQGSDRRLPKHGALLPLPPTPSMIIKVFSSSSPRTSFVLSSTPFGWLLKGNGCLRRGPKLFDLLSTFYIAQVWIGEILGFFASTNGFRFGIGSS